MSKSLIKNDNNEIKSVGNSIRITHKILAGIESQFIPYRKKDKWGFSTTDKEIVIDCIYDNTEQFSKELARVCKNGNYGYINKIGIITIDFPTSDPSQVSKIRENYKLQAFRTKKMFIRDVDIKSINIDGKYGFVDKDGMQIISCIYDLSGEFYEGLAKVKLNGKWGYINKQGVQYWED